MEIQGGLASGMTASLHFSPIILSTRACLGSVTYIILSSNVMDVTTMKSWVGVASHAARARPTRAYKKTSAPHGGSEVFPGLSSPTTVIRTASTVNLTTSTLEYDMGRSIALNILAIKA